MIEIPFVLKHNNFTNISRLSSTVKNISFLVSAKPIKSIFFPFKDNIPHELRSLVVYKFSCSDCNITYVGKSKRHLKTRACEHAGLSDRTGIILKSPQDSAIFSHFSQGVALDLPWMTSLFCVVLRTVLSFRS